MTPSFRIKSHPKQLILNEWIPFTGVIFTQSAVGFLFPNAEFSC